MNLEDTFFYLGETLKIESKTQNNPGIIRFLPYFGLKTPEQTLFYSFLIKSIDHLLKPSKLALQPKYLEILSFLKYETYSTISFQSQWFPTTTTTSTLTLSDPLQYQLFKRRFHKNQYIIQSWAEADSFLIECISRFTSDSQQILSLRNKFLSKQLKKIENFKKLKETQELLSQNSENEAKEKQNLADLIFVEVLRDIFEKKAGIQQKSDDEVLELTLHYLTRKVKPTSVEEFSAKTQKEFLNLLRFSVLDDFSLNFDQFQLIFESNISFSKLLSSIQDIKQDF